MLDRATGWLDEATKANTNPRAATGQTCSIRLVSFTLLFGEYGEGARDYFAGLYSDEVHDFGGMSSEFTKSPSTRPRRNREAGLWKWPDGQHAAALPRRSPSPHFIHKDAEGARKRFGPSCLARCEGFKIGNSQVDPVRAWIDRHRPCSGLRRQSLNPGESRQRVLTGNRHSCVAAR